MRISSAMRCVTINTADPAFRSSRIFANSRSVESRSSAADDSSRIKTLGLRNNARPIVIHWLEAERQDPGQALDVDIRSRQVRHELPWRLGFWLPKKSIERIIRPSP
jgi:hypothetical protein